MKPHGLARRIRAYQATAIFSVFFALVGFSYNVWRLEVNEHNSNVRSASFELLLQLAELEQLVYASHYDGDARAGNPRVGWVKVGLIADLSVSGGSKVHLRAEDLRRIWGQNWEQMPVEQDAAEAIVAAVESTREAVQAVLTSLN